MRWNKFGIFAISILSISVVVFNNLAQLVQAMFLPTFNPIIWTAFGLITIGTITYAVLNKDMLK